MQNHGHGHAHEHLHGHGHEHGHGHAHEHGHGHGHGCEDAHQVGCEHEHGHGHGHARTRMNVNIKGVLLHVIGDALGSVGVIITGLTVKYAGSSSYRFLADPLCSVFIVGVIVTSTMPLLRETVLILLQASPNKMD